MMIPQKQEEDSNDNTQSGHNNNNRVAVAEGGNRCQADAAPSSSLLCNPIFPQLQPSISITLKFEDVVYSVETTTAKTACFSSKDAVTTRTILNGATGIVLPGELLAMMGPSGSGKTTLLTALAGRLYANFSGSVTYNGKPFSSFIKRNTGFVPQDDLFHPHLTVLDTLIYAARLRLPKTLTIEEKIEQAEMTINELGLTRCRNTSIGGPLLRGISGGERKRVSIGQEMIMNPSLLLLDEPTSGLDSTTAERIVATLRRLARGGRTVVTTIHQPSNRLYTMFDKAVVMSEGSMIYSGQAGRVMEYFESIGYGPGCNFINLADFLIDLANGIAPDSKQDDLQEELPQDHQTEIKQYLVSSYRTNLYPSLKAEIQTTDKELESHSAPFTSHEDRWNCSWWEEFVVLLKRDLQERKHESYSGLRIFHTMSLSILSGLFWWRSSISNIQDQVGLLFFSSAIMSLVPLQTAVFAFPRGKALLIKERSSGMYRLSSYFLARIVGDMPMEMLLPAMFVTVLYWMSGLKSSAPAFILTLLVIFLNVLASQGLGLALGAILMDLKLATTLSSMLTSVFFMVVGYYNGNPPGFIAWLKYCSYAYHSLKLLVGVQYAEDELYDCGGGLHCKVKDSPAVMAVGLDRKWLNVAVMMLMVIGYRLAAYVALALRVGHPR